MTLQDHYEIRAAGVGLFPGDVLHAAVKAQHVPPLAAFDLSHRVGVPDAAENGDIAELNFEGGIPVQAAVQQLPESVPVFGMKMALGDLLN